MFIDNANYVATIKAAAPTAVNSAKITDQLTKLAMPSHKVCVVAA